MDLNTFIYNAQNMPSIPEVVQELIESFNSKNVDSKLIASKVSKDQTITAKVLRMANSAKYGGHRQVGSVNEAIVLLGFNALRTLVLASGLTSAFKPPEGFNIRAFWRKSFAMANLSKWTAKLTPNTDPEVAFTCGMLFDIGGLLIHILANSDALEIEHAIAEGGNRLELEARQLGFTFPEVGAELAYRWKFPDYIVNGILNQLSIDPSDDEYEPLAGILFISHYLHNSKTKDLEEVIANFPFEHSAKLGIDKVELTNKIEEAFELDEDIEELLD